MIVNEKNNIFLSIFPFIFPTLILFGFFSGSPIISFLFLVFMGAIVYPFLEECLGPEKIYPHEIICAKKKSPLVPLTNLELISLSGMLILQLTLIFIGIYKASTEGVVWLPYTIILCFTAIPSVVHELYHTRMPIPTFLARIHLVLTFFTHDEKNHLYIHHHPKTACLPSDPAVAKINQSVYSYALQWITGTFSDTWRLYKERLGARNKRLISFENYPLIGLCLSISCTLFILVIFGVTGLLFFVLHIFFQLLNFSIITYSQHYGLARRLKQDKSYEKFSYMNVWSCNTRLGSIISWGVTRHANHHLLLFCPYCDLKQIQDIPIIPMKLFKLQMVCLIPALWYKIMNTEVEKILRRRDELEALGE